MTTVSGSSHEHPIRLQRSRKAHFVQSDPLCLPYYVYYYFSFDVSSHVFDVVTSSAQTTPTNSALALVTRALTTVHSNEKNSGKSDCVSHGAR